MKLNSKLTMKRPLLAAALALALGGCSLAPTFVRPALPVADAYPTAGEEGKAAADVGWREFFKNESLQQAIATALANNRDLRTAALRIEEARALYDVQSADQLPTVNATAGATRSRSLVFTPAPTVRVANNYQVGASLTAFELDLFGRVRNLSKSALAQFFATEEARRAVQVALVGQVANAWLAERALNEQSLLAQRTLAGREESLKLIRKRFDAGVASALDLTQGENLVQTARVASLALKRQHAQAVNALTLLTGAPPKAPSDDVSLSEQNLTTEIGAGLPSALLAQRPDIRAAEQRLLAANANIGAARAAFFPRISLTAAFGVASPELDKLFDAPTRTWSFGPQLVLPLFDAGRNRANLSLAEVRNNIAVADYEKSVQVAFREVADALAARATVSDEVAAQEAVRKTNAQRLELAQARYQNGIASYFEVLDAERELFTAEQQLVQARLLKLTNAVDLYRVLGGGLKETSQ